MHGESLESLSWADLLRKLAHNVASIVDREVELLREEARENAGQMFRAGTMLAVGLVLLLMAVMSFLVAIIFALSLVIKGWLAALIIGAILAIIGGIVTFFGKGRLQLAPLEKTRESLREDVEWVKRHQISNKK